ncbi:MAG TPA: serine hydrolase domain-containing protein [Bryobacteraceae bacterium]|jgi:hypothetical protein|nr:serine hydrolase domain-containing protein [Bryobacteraceae bacterium]
MRTLLFALTLAVCMNGQPAKSKLTEVDHIFAAFNTHTPGCAEGVSEHGTIALLAGYGMADLERGVPLNADTVFERGSVAKQFTAMAILLLAQQGKISLDDARFLQSGSSGNSITFRLQTHLFDVNYAVAPVYWVPKRISEPCPIRG